MSVEPFKAAASIEHAGQLYHFCSKGCAEKFSGDPAKYLSPGYIPGGMSSPVMIRGIATAPAAKPAGTPASLPVEKTAAVSIRRHLHLSHGPRGSPVASRSVPEMRNGAGTRNSTAGDSHPVDMPDASGDCARRAGRLSHLRHGAGTDDSRSGRGRESRTARHDAPLLVERGSRHPAGVVCHVAHGATRRTWSLPLSATGSSSCWRHRWFCGAAVLSSSGDGRR